MRIQVVSGLSVHCLLLLYHHNIRATNLLKTHIYVFLFFISVETLALKGISVNSPDTVIQL